MLSGNFSIHYLASITVIVVPVVVFRQKKSADKLFLRANIVTQIGVHANFLLVYMHQIFRKIKSFLF